MTATVPVENLRTKTNEQGMHAERISSVMEEDAYIARQLCMDRGKGKEFLQCSYNARERSRRKAEKVQQL